MHSDKLIKAAKRLPKRSPILMNSAKGKQRKTKFVSGDFVRRFCKTIVGDCLDGRCSGYEEFAFGVAAMLDAMSRGTIDMDEHPRNVVKQMWDDVNNATKRPNKITNIMRIGARN